MNSKPVTKRKFLAATLGSVVAIDTLANAFGISAVPADAMVQFASQYSRRVVATEDGDGVLRIRADIEDLQQFQHAWADKNLPFTPLQAKGTEILASIEGRKVVFENVFSEKRAGNFDDHTG